MPFLGSKRCHEACEVRIRSYLELKDGHPRAIGHDFVNIHGEDHRRNWGYLMDRTREAFGNDRAWGGKRAVLYNHFVVSPDPKDGVDLDTLRELTMRWVREFFGNDLAAGKLGSYEVAVVYHDDNEGRVPHAHVIVNNTDLDSGRRLQIDNASNLHALPDRLQEIAREMGLRHFDNDEGEAMRRKTMLAGRYFTKEERELMRNGRFCWKQDIANNIQVARRTSRTEGEFIDACAKLGITVETKGEDWVFSHPANPKRWRASGHRIGRSYSRDGLLAAIAGDAGRRAPRSPLVRENVAAHIGDGPLEAYRITQGFVDGMKLAAVVERGVTVAQAAKTLKANDDFGIRCAEDYDREIAKIDAILGSCGEGAAKGYIAQRRILAEAREIAKRGNFFAGIADAGARASAWASLPADEAADSGKARGQDGSIEHGRLREHQRQDRSRGKAR